MTFKHTLMAAGLAACALATAQAAFAQASATLGPWTYDLVDLNPGDGAAPTFSFTEYNRSGAVKVFGNTAFEGDPVASASITAAGTASASFQGTATATSLPDSVSARLDLTNVSGTAVADADYSFVLSPNTRLILSVPANVSGGFHNFAGDGDAIATLSGNWVSDTSPRVPFGTFQTSLNSPGLAGGGSATLSGVVNSEDGVSGFLHLHTFASGFGVSPVPEPASVAMLLAGLGLLGGVAQRRRRTGLPPRA